jgi:membrane-bound lytic murein transglycosylase B
MKKIFALGILFSFTFISFSEAKVNPEDVEKFIEKVTQKHGLDKNKVMDIIHQAKHQQSIIDAMNRPAERTLKWFEYRNIFLKQDRIEKGATFWKEHESILNDVSQETGVPIEIIVAIIGVETYYGKIMGNYKVLDALYTLSFDYPKRSKFFSGELEKFLILLDKENLSHENTKGSYAGAMGFGQFISSSYLAYAVDYDKDGKRDLLNNKADAIASVANYFKQHGWKNGQPVILKAKTKDGFTTLKKQELKPSLSVSELNDFGYFVEEKLNPKEMVSLTQLDQKDHKEYWFGLHNFYVITRYNHSEMYAMAVYQLAQEIKALKK